MKLTIQMGTQKLDNFWYGSTVTKPGDCAHRCKRGGWCQNWISRAEALRL